jgi:hypothetical protein
MATTTENIVFDTTINLGNSTNSVKSLKSELKDLRNQLGTLEQGSEAFNQAAQRAGQLQERIRGVNDAIENADPEKKFAPFARTLQGMAGGFAAVQGAMGLFGSESKDLEKTLLKVQSAMALSQGLNSLLEFKNDFKDLGTMIVNNVVKAFTTLRGAIIATGIGLLAVTVGVLVTNWKEFSQAITDAFPGFKVVTDFFNNFKQIAAGTLASVIKGFEIVGDVVGKVFAGDFSGAIKSAKTFGEETAKAYSSGFAEEDRKIKIENGIKQRKQNLELLEAQGKDVRDAKIKLMQDELSILKKGSDEYNAKLIEIEKARTDLRKEAAEKKKKEEEDEKNRQDDKLKEARSDYEFYQNLNKEKDEKDLKKKQDEESEMLDAELSSLMAAAETSVSITKKEKEAKKKLSEEEVQHRLILNNAIASGLNTLSDLVGKNTVEGKLLAIASSTISTYTAIAGQLAAFSGVPVPGYAIVQAIATGVAGFAAVKNIIDTPVPGQGGSGGTVPNFTAPSIPQIPQSVSGTRLNQTDPLRTINEGRDSKVFVTETDITKTQNKVKNIIKKATIK